MRRIVFLAPLVLACSGSASGLPGQMEDPPDGPADQARERTQDATDAGPAPDVQAEGEPDASPEAMPESLPELPPAIDYPPRDVMCGSSLVAWWRADGDASDSVGSSDGKLVGGTYSEGWTGGAFTLDGKNDYVEAEGSSRLSIGTGDFTIALWLKVSSHKDETAIFQKGSGAYPTDRTMAIEVMPTQIRFLIRDGTKNENDFYVAHKIPVGEWHHLVGVRKGDTLRIFVDAALIDERTAGSAIDTGPGGIVRLGGLIDAPDGISWGRWLNGSLDDVRVYSRALTSSEVGDVKAYPEACP